MRRRPDPEKSNVHNREYLDKTPTLTTPSDRHRGHSILDPRGNKSTRQARLEECNTISQPLKAKSNDQGLHWRSSFPSETQRAGFGPEPPPDPDRVAEDKLDDKTRPRCRQSFEQAAGSRGM